MYTINIGNMYAYVSGLTDVNNANAYTIEYPNRLMYLILALSLFLIYGIIQLNKLIKTNNAKNATYPTVLVPLITSTP